MWGNHGVPTGASWVGSWQPALPWPGAPGGLVLPRQPQRFLLSEHEGWEINGGEKMRWLHVPRLLAQCMVCFHPGATKAAGLKSLGVLGPGESPRRGLILPGGLGLPREGVGGWETAGAIMGCPVRGGRLRLP